MSNKTLKTVIFGSLLLASSALASVPSAELDAIVELYDDTNGPGWTISTNWLIGDPCADAWYGVTCDAGYSTITSVGLWENNLVGTIPPELGNLANLQELNLSGNLLSGSIPVELGNLSNLRWLYLTDNQLSESIPAQLVNLVNLEDLHLWGNQLNGSIPAELGSLINLRHLDLGDNQLSGGIPAELGNLANLQTLDLYNNQLNGSIPVELGDLINLHNLNLWGNQLGGSIPVELGSLVNLSNLVLGNNQLNGSIPIQLGSLINLLNLNLSGNQLSGSIPVVLGELTNLHGLILRFNQLNGGIPVEIGNLLSLEDLALSNNQLTGNLPSELGNLTNLWQLELKNNHLSGPIPSEYGNLVNLQWLFLYSNQLSGPVPVTLSNLTSLGEGQTDLGWNALYASDGGLDTFLDAKSGYDWSTTQTVAPTNVSVTNTTEHSATLIWNPIEYTTDLGGYRVWYGTSSGGPFSDGGITASKSSASHTVSGLKMGQRYYFVLQTETNGNQNYLVSGDSIEVSGTTQGGCNANVVSGVIEYSDATHEACEILALGPDFIAADGSNVYANSGWEIDFLPGFAVELGATLNANVCGRSLCMTSPDPMPYGCHSCVNHICDIDPSCCALEFDQACVDKVDTVCGLICE